MYPVATEKEREREGLRAMYAQSRLGVESLTDGGLSKGRERSRDRDRDNGRARDAGRAGASRRALHRGGPPSSRSLGRQASAVFPSVPGEWDDGSSGMQRLTTRESSLPSLLPLMPVSAPPQSLSHSRSFGRVRDRDRDRARETALAVPGEGRPVVRSRRGTAEPPVPSSAAAGPARRGRSRTNEGKELREREREAAHRDNRVDHSAERGERDRERRGAHAHGGHHRHVVHSGSSGHADRQKRMSRLYPPCCRCGCLHRHPFACVGLWVTGTSICCFAIFLLVSVLLLLPAAKIAILPGQSAVVVGNLCAQAAGEDGVDAFSVSVNLVVDNPASVSASLDATDLLVYDVGSNDLLLTTSLPESVEVEPGVMTVRFESTIRPANAERWASLVSAVLDGERVPLRLETTVTVWILDFFPVTVDVAPTFEVGPRDDVDEDVDRGKGAFLRALSVEENSADALQLGLSLSLNATALQLIAVEVPALAFTVSANATRPSSPDAGPRPLLTDTVVTTRPFFYAPGWATVSASVAVRGDDSTHLGDVIGAVLEDGEALVGVTAGGAADSDGCFLQQVLANVQITQTVQLAGKGELAEMADASMQADTPDEVLDRAVTSSPNTAPLSGEPGVVDAIAPPTPTPTTDPTAPPPTPAPPPPPPPALPKSPHLHSVSLLSISETSLHLAALVDVTDAFALTGTIPPLRVTLGPFALAVDETHLQVRDDNAFLLSVGVKDSSQGTLDDAFALVSELMAGEVGAAANTTVRLRGDILDDRNDTISRILAAVDAQVWPATPYRAAADRARARAAAAARNNATAEREAEPLYESVWLDVTTFDTDGFVAVANVTVAGASVTTNVTLPDLVVDLVAETPGFEGEVFGSVVVGADLTLDGGETGWGGASLRMQVLLPDAGTVARAFVEPWFYDSGDGVAVRLRGRGDGVEPDGTPNILRRFMGQLDKSFVLGGTPTTTVEADEGTTDDLRGVDGPLTVTVDSLGDDSLLAHARFGLPTGWLGTSAIADTVVAVGHAPRSPGLSEGSALGAFAMQNRLATVVLSLAVNGDVAEARVAVGDVVTSEGAALAAAVWGSQEHSVLVAGDASNGQAADHWLQRLLNEARIVSDVVRHASAAPGAAAPRGGSSFVSLSGISTVYDDSDPGWLHAEASLAMNNRLLDVDLPPLSLTLHNRSCPVDLDYSCHQTPLVEVRLAAITVRRHQEVVRLRVSLAVRDGRALDELVSSVLAKRPYQLVAQGVSTNAGLAGALLRDARLGLALYDPAGAAERGDATAGDGVGFSTAFTLRDTTTDTVRLNLRMVADVARTVPWSAIDIGVLTVTLRVDGALIATVTTPDIVLRQGERFQGDAEIVVSAAESREYFESIVTRLFDERAQLDFEVSGSLDKPERRDEAQWDAPVAVEMAVRVPPLVSASAPPGQVEAPRTPAERTLIKCIEVTAKRFQIAPCKPDLDLMVWLENPVAVLPLELVELHVVVDFDDADGGWGSGAADDIEIGRIDDLQAISLPADSIVPYATTLVGTDRGALELCTRLADELLDNTLTLDIAPLVAVIRIDNFFMTVRLSMADIFINMDGPTALPCATQIAEDYPTCGRSIGGGFICD